RTTHLLVVVQRKMHEQPFCPPFQEVYESMVPDEARARYVMVIDGELMDGKRVKYMTKDTILAKEYLSEIQGLKNLIESYRGQVDTLRNELGVTTHILNQVTHGSPPPNVWTGRIAELEAHIAELQSDLRAARDSPPPNVWTGQIAELEAHIAELQGNLGARRSLAGEAGRELVAEVRPRGTRRPVKEFP